MSLEIISVTEDSDIPPNAGSYCLLSPGNSTFNCVFLRQKADTQKSLQIRRYDIL